MITKVSGGKAGQVRYHFDNGVCLSFIWDWGSYSDNYMERPEYDKNMREVIKDWSSTTAEVYSNGDNPNGIDEYITKKYGDNPVRIPVKDIPAILKRADKVNPTRSVE